MFDIALYHLCFEDYNQVRASLQRIGESSKEAIYPSDRPALEAIMTLVLPTSPEAGKQTPSFQLTADSTPADGQQMLKLVRTDEIPLYWRLNYELSTR